MEKKEAMKILKDFHDKSALFSVRTALDTIFPELKESEDEKIRKALIRYHKSTIDIDGIKGDKIVSWLEKQGKSYTKRDVDDVFVKGMAFAKDELEKQGEQKSIWHNEDEEPKRGSLILLIMQSGTPIVAKIIEPNHTFNHGERWAYIDDLLEKQSEQILANSAKTCKNEQKPTDKVKPKFKIGEWITNGDYTWKIVEVKPLDYILQSQNGNIVDDTISHVDEQFHSFTIEDAKTGDVLASELCDSIILFKGINDDNNIDFYCDYDFSEIDLPGDRFSVNNGQHYGNVEDSKDFYPATKEQRDTLLKAMADAGYIFDFEKKELKKIEQGPAWSKEDEYRTEKLLGWFNTLINYIHEDAMVSLDLRMERIQQVEQIKTWLKSLKDRITWKPSEQQMNAIKIAIAYMTDECETPTAPKVLCELLEQLKKLTE